MTTDWFNIVKAKGQEEFDEDRYDRERVLEGHEKLIKDLSEGNFRGVKLAPKDLKGFSKIVDNMRKNIESKEKFDAHRKYFYEKTRDFNDDFERVKRFGYFVALSGAKYHFDTTYYDRMMD
jgi:hypothetical protein